MALSIVGVEQPSDGGYHTAKAAKRIIHESRPAVLNVPATHFFEFIIGIADRETDGDTVTMQTVLVEFGQRAAA